MPRLREVRNVRGSGGVRVSRWMLRRVLFGAYRGDGSLLPVRGGGGMQMIRIRLEDEQTKRLIAFVYCDEIAPTEMLWPSVPTSATQSVKLRLNGEMVAHFWTGPGETNWRVVQ